jgi:hypothetical protein
MVSVGIVFPILEGGTAEVVEAEGAEVEVGVVRGARYAAVVVTVEDAMMHA